MTHAYHDALPGYNSEQILHDGCEECEARGADPYLAITNLDIGRFAQAWARAAELNVNGLTNGSYAELPLLRVLLAVQVQFERIGFPLGFLPSLA